MARQRVQRPKSSVAKSKKSQAKPGRVQNGRVHKKKKKVTVEKIQVPHVSAQKSPPVPYRRSAEPTTTPKGPGIQHSSFSPVCRIPGFDRKRVWKNSDFQFHKELGRGTFGTVHLVSFRKWPLVNAALKLMDHIALRNLDWRPRDAKVEFNLHNKLRHINISQVLGFVTNKGSSGFLMELYEEGDLTKYNKGLCLTLPKLEARMRSLQEFLLVHGLIFSILTVSTLSQTIPPEDELLLDEIQRAAFDFFWEEADPNSGLVKDRALASGGPDPRDVASIASTGFGLVALSIGYERNYGDRSEILNRISNTLKFIIDGHLEGHNGFFYHFVNMTSGKRVWECELSSIDTALLLGGIQFVRQYFPDQEYIVNAATQIYEAVDFEWMLNGGDTLSMGWHPENDGVFITDSWNRYCELMILVLQAVGSTTHPIPASAWDAFTRTTITYEGHTYIDGNGPLFTHQFSHAFIDFRNLKDEYANYWDNSVVATEAHKHWCIEFLGANFSSYGEDFWGLTASDTPYGYDAWGGPPLKGKPDGAIVPCAAAGSVPFLPQETIAVLRNVKNNYPLAWGAYGYVDAFNPIMTTEPWYNPDVIGIDVGVTMLMLENYRTGFVWQYYMQDGQLKNAMSIVGFVQDVYLDEHNK